MKIHPGLSRAEKRTILRECEVRKEDSDISARWGIWHIPSGRRISGPPEPFYHPQLQGWTTICKRRWKRRAEAVEALETMREMVAEGQTELFEGVA